MPKPNDIIETTQQLSKTAEPIQITAPAQQEELSETAALQQQIQQVSELSAFHSVADFSVAPQNAVKNAIEKSSWKNSIKAYFRPKQAAVQEPAEITNTAEQTQAQEQTKTRKQKKESFARITLEQAYENETQERSLAYHQVLKENIAYDAQLKDATPAYQTLMAALKDYTDMDVTKSSYSRLSAQVSKIQKLFTSYPDGAVPSEKEWNIFNRYQLYFDINFNGTLEQIPNHALHDDYSKKDIATGRWYSDNYDVSDQPLFAKEPSVDDIEQRLLGDCYLQAALVSLVQQDPQTIKSCMRDNGNGTVTVRFFQKDNQTDTMVPKYVTVKKTIPKSLGMDTFSANNLWVQMIEKAYAASGLHNISEDTYLEAEKKNHIGENNPEAREKFREEYKRSYSGIESGSSSEFLEILTGKTHIDKEIHSTTITTLCQVASYYYLQQALITSKDSSQFAANINTLHTTFTCYLSSIMMQVMDSSAKKVKPSKYIANPNHVTIEDVEYILEHTFSNDTWLADSQKKLLNAIPKEEQESLLKDYKKRLIHLLEAHEFKDIPQIDHAGIIERNEHGVYSNSMIDLYNEIQEALKAGKTVCCGTKDFDGRQSGRNGETEANGMVGNHAYTILGCEERHGHKFIRLRNPWNTGVLEYVKITEPDGTVHFTSSQRKHLITKDTGIFLLELADFKNIANRIYY